jgi:hypothetical protein
MLLGSLSEKKNVMVDFMCITILSKNKNVRGGGEQIRVVVFQIPVSK